MWNYFLQSPFSNWACICSWKTFIFNETPHGPTRLFDRRGSHRAETAKYIFQWSALTRPQQTTLLNVTQWMLSCWLCENLCCTTLLRFVAALDLAWLKPDPQLKTDAKSAKSSDIGVLKCQRQTQCSKMYGFKKEREREKDRQPYRVSLYFTVTSLL